MGHKCGKFCVVSFGLALGIIGALWVFLMGLASMLTGWGTPMVVLMGTTYLGYKATVIGSIIGAIWGFVDGFITGIIFAALYNLFACMCHHDHTCKTCEPKTEPRIEPPAQGKQL